MKILVLALSGIGDALMFTPAVKELRKEFPDANIDAMVMYLGVKDIYSRTELFNNIFYYNFINSNFLSALNYISQFMGEYDVTINVYPSNRREYNIISFLIGAKQRLAIKYLRRDFFSFGFLNNQRVVENDNLHNVEENYRLVELLINKKISLPDKYIFNLQKEDETYAEDFFTKNNLSDNDLIIGFHPGCSTLKNHSNRRWPISNFAELAAKLCEKHNAKVLIFGGNDESTLKSSIARESNLNSVIVVDTDNLAQTAAIMKFAKVFVSNDSSLMHVAAALELNVVAIIGPTNTDYIHPWMTEFRIASLNLECSPCFFHSPKPLSCSRTDIKFKCIHNLDVDSVYQKVLEFLQQTF